MTKTAQQEQEPGSVQSLRGCFRHTFPSPATWWVFNHHNRSLHEWSGDSLCADVPIRPNTKQVLVVRPRGGRSGKNWRIFVRPREVGVKIDFSPKAAGRRWNGDFHPRPDRKVASCRGFGLGNTRLQSVYTKPNLIHLQIHKLTGATLFARNPPYHLHECPTLLAHSLDAYQRTKYWMILELRLIHQVSGIWIILWIYSYFRTFIVIILFFIHHWEWYLNPSLEIFSIQDMSFILYMVNVTVNEVHSPLDGFWVLSRDIFKIYLIHCKHCGFLGFAETCVDLVVCRGLFGLWESCVDLMWLGSCSRGWRGGRSRIVRGCTHPTQHKTSFGCAT